MLTGVKQNTDGNKIAWFGYNLHIATDIKSELPIALEVTPASVHDSIDIYTSVKYDHKAQALIPLNLRGAKEPKAGFDFDGTPICSGGYRMIYWGHDKDANKFRCPHILGKCDCTYVSAWCSESNYGMVIKTRVKDDPRLFGTPQRGTDNWRKLYNKRTGVERCFGRLKEHIGLDNLTLSGLAKVKSHAYLCAISLLVAVIAVNSVKKEQL